MVSIDEARTVKARYADQLMQAPGACGVGTELSEDGQGIIVVHLDPTVSGAGDGIPSQIETVPIRLVFDGPFIAQSAGERRRS